MRTLIAAVSMLALSASASFAQQTSPAGQAEAPATEAGTEAGFMKTMEEMVGATVLGADRNEIGTVSDVIFDPEAKRAQRLVVDTAEGRQVALDFDDAHLELDQNRISMDTTTAEDVAGMEEYSADEADAGTSLKATGEGG